MAFSHVTSIHSRHDVRRRCCWSVRFFYRAVYYSLAGRAPVYRIRRTFSSSRSGRSSKLRRGRELSRSETLVFRAVHAPGISAMLLYYIPTRSLVQGTLGTIREYVRSIEFLFFFSYSLHDSSTLVFFLSSLMGECFDE